VIVVEFTKDFSKITDEQFVKEFLHDILKVKVVVAGFDHHFGFNKEGNYRQLRNWQEKYDFFVEEVSAQEIGHEIVSSAKIRLAISEGNIPKANILLGHDFIVMGIPCKERAPLHDLYEVAITDECKLLPPEGIYEISALHSKATAVIQFFSGQRRMFVDTFYDTNTPVTFSFHSKIQKVTLLNIDTLLSAKMKFPNIKY